jgi:hypothetical protein
MRNLLALVGLLVVVVGAVGWYCGWFKLSVSKGTDGKPAITTTVDTQKVSDDSSAFFQKVGKLIEEKSQQTGPDGNAPQPATTPGNTPAPDSTSQGGWFTPGKNGSKGQ